MVNRTILILGEHDPGYDLHQATREAVLHAAGAQAIVANTRWMGAEDVLLYPGLVAEADAVILAPDRPAPPTELPVAILQAIRDVRERGRPFLATGSAHGLVLLEAARNLGGLGAADSVEFCSDTAVPVIHRLGKRELGESDAAGRRRVTLERVHPEIAGEGLAAGVEITDIRFGLNPDYAPLVESTGLVPVLVDRHGGRPYLQVRPGGVLHAVAAYLPQLRSRAGAPHPLFRALLQAIHGT